MNDDEAAPLRWLLLIYRIPQDPPGYRTYVWRQLKQLGAVYLQQAAAILPDRPEACTALAALAERIRSYPGEVSLLTTVSPTPAWEADLVARFNAARDEEYAEFVENVERLEDELSREGRKGKFTFAELEENEATVDKLDRWLERIRARDFFGAAGDAGAMAAHGRGRAALQSFAATVYAHAGMEREGASDGDGID